MPQKHGPEKWNYPRGPGFHSVEMTPCHLEVSIPKFDLGRKPYSLLWPPVVTPFNIGI